MKKKVAIFWPGDYRALPNELGLPNVEQATSQLENALAKLGRQTYRVKGFLTKPYEAIEKLGPIDDPMVGVCVHWFYGPHTTDGVVGKDNPLLLASNFSDTWPFMAAHLGVRQDTVMAHYMSNHIAVAYGDIFEELVALSQMVGFKVRVFGATAR